jgi:hypothetical protein
MNSIEEKLWAFIDGTCSAADQEEISKLIETDSVYGEQYSELLLLNSEFEKMEMDEPPMAFTYNVMELIRTQEALVPLKAGINKNIIRGIIGFFVLSISILLIVVLRDINWGNNQTGFKLPAQVAPSRLTSIFTGSWMNAFLLFDVVLGLFLLDTVLRKNRNINSGEIKLNL